MAVPAVSVSTPIPRGPSLVKITTISATWSRAVATVFGLTVLISFCAAGILVPVGRFQLTLSSAAPGILVPISSPLILTLMAAMILTTPTS